MALNEIPGARLVDQSKLREGDRIFVLAKEPEVVIDSSDSDGDVETVGDFYNPDHYDFYLVSRKEQKIPDDAGRVIELTLADGEVQRWLSWHDFSQGKILWVKSDNGTRQSMTFMQQRVNSAEGFEVIL